MADPSSPSIHDVPRLGQAREQGHEDIHDLYDPEVLHLSATLPRPQDLSVLAPGLVGEVAEDNIRERLGRGEVHSSLCGSHVVANLRFIGDRITALSLEVSACALGRCAAHLLLERFKREEDSLPTALTVAEFQAGHRILRDLLMGQVAARPPVQGPRRDRLKAVGWERLALLEPAGDFPSRHSSILLAFDATAAALLDSGCHSEARNQP